MESIPIYDRNGEEKGKVDFDQDLFAGDVRKSLLHQAAVMYRANMRAGTASTLTRDKVRGGGNKPWRQKGTGRARAGSSSSPLWRGGGVTFGPRCRDYGYHIPRKARKEALVSAFNAKLKDKGIIFIDELKLEKPKTGNFVEILRKLQLRSGKNQKRVTDTVLVLIKAPDSVVARSSRNIPGVTLKTIGNFSAYDLLICSKVLVTMEAWEALMEKMKSLKEKRKKA